MRGVLKLAAVPFVVTALLVVVAGATTVPPTAGCAGASSSGLPVSTGGVVVAGRVSTFGPPGEAAGATASGNPGGDAVPGVSLHIAGTHYSDPSNQALMGHWFRVVIGAHQADLPDIDLGPADYLNRAIDVTGAGASQMGISPQAFPTDSQGSATELAGRPAGAGTAVPVSLPLSPGVACAATPTVGPGQYINAFSRSTGLIPRRIDMGVDYDGHGPILAIGRALVKFAGVGIGGNWVCSNSTNGGVTYQLLDGPDAGRFVYVNEDVTPTVHAGQTVQAGQQVATFTGTSPCIETGWAAGPNDNTEAAALGQQSHSSDAGALSTYCGMQFSALLHALGAVAGVQGTQSGTSCPPMT